MKRKIAVLCPSEIAWRRFMPALQASGLFEFAGVGLALPSEWCLEGGIEPAQDEVAALSKRERQKAEAFIGKYGGRVYPSYQAVVEAPDVDAVYIPLPPALHARWGKAVLENGKHAFIEKPMATTLADASELVETARGRNLVLHENYMFLYHRQLREIEQFVASGGIGTCMLYRVTFGFPLRAGNDFRYSRALGGGALLDCGGYTLCLARRLLGETARIAAACSTSSGAGCVDLHGSGMLTNDKGVVAQIAFGMDNGYRCDLEAWGTLGSLISRRILTAPPDFIPEMEIRVGDRKEVRPLPVDDAFGNSIGHFRECMEDPASRARRYAEVLHQAEILEDFRRHAFNCRDVRNS